MSVIQDGQLLSWRESKKLSTSVEAGKDISLKVSWDQEDKRVSIVYDRDTKTDKNRKVTLAEFKYAGAPMREGSVSLILQRMNKGGSSAATLTHWQVAPAKKKCVNDVRRLLVKLGKLVANLPAACLRQIDLIRTTDNDLICQKDG